MEQFKYSEITSKIISCALKVHTTLRNGFQEVIYQRALFIEMNEAGILFSREVTMPIYYNGIPIGSRRVDFLVENIIIMEIKATSTIEPVHIAQALNYLEAFNQEIGMLINFGGKSLEVRRLKNKKYNIELLSG